MAKYIPLDALVAEIEKLKNELKASDCAAYKEAYIIGAEHTIKTISDVIDTLEVIEIGVDLGDHKGDKSAKYIIDTNSLEVKEADLEKEIELVKGDYEQVDVAWNDDFDYIAKHFFELGLKAQKGEEV